jgi:hypothetical protein
MFCERLHSDPEDACNFCEGSGQRRWFDAACGWSSDPCPACGGVATAGVFVLHLVAGEVRLEAQWYGTDFTEACRRAHSLARHARPKLSRYAVTAEARVIYLPTDRRELEECVYRDSVWRALPLSAA